MKTRPVLMKTKGPVRSLAPTLNLSEDVAKLLKITIWFRFTAPMPFGEVCFQKINFALRSAKSHP